LSATPLAGVEVLDLSRHLPGPLAAHLLADLGARVVKVEEPELGDPLRHAPPLSAGRSALAAPLLAGVESATLDLKSRAGRTALERLLESADVLLESFRPGTLARLGFPPAELRQRHPRLVVCSLSGWGQEGPHAKRAGHDLTYQALAGTLAPTAAMPALPVADLAGAWSVVTSILAALYEREKTGSGAHLDVALFDAALHANLVNWAAEANGPWPVGHPLPLSGAIPCYNLYRAADGAWLALAALEPRFWQRFCRAAGRPDLIRYQYRTTPKARRKVADLIAQRPRAAWMELCEREDIPAEPVLAAAEARNHPQAQARAVLQSAEDGLPRLAFPARFDGERPHAAALFPPLGGRTAEVLRELGLPEAGLPERKRRKLGLAPRGAWKRLIARWRSR
jgi:alpha-methylacyl-CoA racemase